MSDIKWIYCPEYDKFLQDCRPILKGKIKTHLNERQIAVFKASTQMILELNSVYQCSSQNTRIPEYLESVINDNDILKSIDVLVDQWNGPTYGNRLIHELNGDEQNVEIIDSKKFTIRAINWVQQTSYKIFGLFFAKHIINIKQHLVTHCPSNMKNYGCFKFAVELLNGEITLHRSGRKPLIRHTTLRDSVDIQTAFGNLHHSLNLMELKNIIKAKRKSSGKYTITAQSLAEEFKKRCNDLLEKEKSNLGLSFERNNIDDKSIPLSPKYHHTTNIGICPVYSNRTYNYGGDRGGNYIGSARNVRFGPYCYNRNMNRNDITLRQINNIRHKETNLSNKRERVIKVEANNCGNVNEYNRMNNRRMSSNDMGNKSISISCSACCHNAEMELCQRCQGILNDINKLDYRALTALVNRSIPYANYLAELFTATF